MINFVVFVLFDAFVVFLAEYLCKLVYDASTEAFFTIKKGEIA